MRKGEELLEDSLNRQVKALWIFTILIVLVCVIWGVCLYIYALHGEIDDLGAKNGADEQTLEQYDNLAIESNIEGLTTSVNVTYNEDYAVGSFRVYISTNEEFLLISIYVDEELVYSRHTDVVMGREMLEYYYYPNKQIKVVIE